MEGSSSSRFKPLSQRKRAYLGRGTAIDLEKEVVEILSDDSDSEEKMKRMKTKGKEIQVYDVIDDKRKDIICLLDDDDSDAAPLNFQFANFAVVDDYSDHHYADESLKMQPVKAWSKRIEKEWRILKSSLPDTIFVRAYESRMDLLRAVIVGAHGTPYHDGLYFFDVQFPPGYPYIPPQVHYHSGGLYLNPNLYVCGKVCLSLLGTWIGEDSNENWLPEKSTMLQVLVSIQALILNAKPFFNEPGEEEFIGTALSEQESECYNESTFILSLKTMQYSLQNPLKHFEDLISHHFVARAHNILQVCKEYMNGAQVGSVSIVEGKAVVGNITKRSSSTRFNSQVREMSNSLISAFTELGVKNLDEFQTPKSNEAKCFLTSTSRLIFGSSKTAGWKDESGSFPKSSPFYQF